MRVFVHDDILTNYSDGAGDPVLPDEFVDIPLERIRYFNGAFTDAAALKVFYVDADGIKHALPGEGRQAVECAWDAVVRRDGDTWIALSADDTTRRACLSRLDLDTRNEITAGFNSSALDSVEHVYASSLPDQMNLLTAAQVGKGGLIWCGDKDGKWEAVNHSAAQVSQVLTDLKAHVEGCRKKLVGARARLAEATGEAVKAVSL